MSVIVKGMELPACCWDCPLLKHETNFHTYCGVTRKARPYYEIAKKRSDDCPLVGVEEVTNVED